MDFDGAEMLQPILYDSEMQWIWARQGSNLRPSGYEPRALPLSYGPGRADDIILPSADQVVKHPGLKGDLGNNPPGLFPFSRQLRYIMYQYDE